MAEVVLENLDKTYPGDRKTGPVPAVQDVNLTVADHEFLVFVGPSGCGKSTTLRMIAGLESITRGTITIDGRVVNELPPKDRDIAMVFQNYALYPHMNVFDNMAFGLKLRKFSKQEIRDRVDEAAHILGLDDLLERKPKALSGGQRQRVALGRAIVRQPKVFLFDEPLSNLDAKMRVQMRAEITKLHQKLQATMIYVTHDQVEAMTMGDRIVVMQGGRVQQIDQPLQLYNEPVNTFVAGFIGSPPMNFLQGRLEQQDGRCFFQEGDGGKTRIDVSGLDNDEGVLAQNAGKAVTFGVRPEDILQEPDDARETPVCFRARVELAEPLGAETNLYLQTGRHSLVCRGPGSLAHGVEDRELLFRIRPAGIRLFSGETGQRIL